MTVEVRTDYQILKIGAVFLELRMMELAAQKFRNDFMLAQGTRDGESGIVSTVLRRGNFLAQERQRHHDEKNNHEHQLHEDDLLEILMKGADAQHQRTAERELNPAGVRDLSGHLVGDHDRTQRINAGRHRVQYQQRSQAADISENNMSTTQSHTKK